jgi:hypothetical protein
LKAIMKTGIALALVLLATGGSTDCRSEDRAAPAAAAATAASPAPARRQGTLTSLDKMLAPIALYPDQLLAQILMSASDPPKVVELDKWLKANQSIKGTPLQDAALKAGFEPSFVALTLFPQVVAAMATNIDATTLVGQAFAADRSTVFASIQRLRHQAQEVGTLKTTPQQEVRSQETPEGENVIVIEPANPQVVYVPQYNPEVVYTTPPATTTNTTVIVENNSADAAVAAGVIGFTAGIAIGAAVNNNYYYGPYGWHGGAYMYNNAWNDYYDHREDAREDYIDHREDVMEERTDRMENRQDALGDRSGTAQQQRTERQQTRQDSGTQRTTQQRSTSAQSATQSATQRTGRTGSAEARGYSDASRSTQSAQQRKGTSSNAFSGYSSGQSTRSSSARGQQSRSSSRGGGGRRR